MHTAPLPPPGSPTELCNARVGHQPLTAARSGNARNLAVALEMVLMLGRTHTVEYKDDGVSRLVICSEAGA